MQQLESYVNGKWQAGNAAPVDLLNPASGEVLAQTSTEGVDFAAALDFARNTGGPALRALNFAQRAAMLQSMYDAIYAHRDELLDLSIANGGNTRNDAKFDVDGATGTLLAYAELGKSLGEQTFLLDGEVTQLGRTPRYAGRHLLTPRQGVAVHINAYNFPAWGFAEKAGRGVAGGNAGHHKAGNQHSAARVSHDAVHRRSRCVARRRTVVHCRICWRYA